MKTLQIVGHTEKGVSEELVGFYFVERCLKETLLAQFIVGVIVFQILEFLSLLSK